MVGIWSNAVGAEMGLLHQLMHGIVLRLKGGGTLIRFYLKKLKNIGRYLATYVALLGIEK